MIPGVNVYVLAAAGVLVVGALGYGAFEHQRYLVAKADLVAYQAQAEAETQKLRAKAAEVRIEVVTKYVDRVKTIRVPEPVEVVREIEVIRNSDCKLPAAWVRLHNATPRSGIEAPAGTDDAAEVTCAAAIETVRENYKRFTENAAQLEALQSWAAQVSQ